MSLCVPILCGAPVKIRPEGDKRWVLCPSCHERTAFTALRARWLEFFFIPVIPLSWEHIWFCDTCQWTDAITKEERKELLKEAAQSRAMIESDLGEKGEHTDVAQPSSPLPPQPLQPGNADCTTNRARGFSWGSLGGSLGGTSSPDSPSPPSPLRHSPLTLSSNSSRIICQYPVHTPSSGRTEPPASIRRSISEEENGPFSAAASNV